MKRFLYELEESWRIAYAQMRSNLTRSTLTALGVIIGIVAVTLMGTAIGGISAGFDKSMAVLGDDVLYVTQWPWKPVDDWWNYRDRKKIKTEYAETINRMIAATPNSGLMVAVPTSSLMRSIKYGGNEVENVFTLGTTSDFTLTSTIDCKEGRFFNEIESRDGAQVVVIGYDVADALFPSDSPIDKSVLINGHQFKVIGVNARQGTFLGLFSWDSMVAMPLAAFNKYFDVKSEKDVRGQNQGESDVRVKVKDKTKLVEAKDELTGMMRRVRSLPPEKKEEHARSGERYYRDCRPVHHRSFPLRRRNRDHEYHVREREGAHQRNWDAQSARRATANDSPPILDRIDRALSAGRFYWADHRLFHVFRNRQSVPVVSNSIFLGTCDHEHDRLGSHRIDLRVRASLVGVAPRSGDCSPLRIDRDAI